MTEHRIHEVLAAPGARARYLDCGRAFSPGRLSEKIIDAHCHIYPDAIAAKAVRGIDAFYDGLPTAHLDGTVGTLLAAGTEERVDGCVVHSVATTARQVGRINRFVADCVREGGGRLIGLGTLHPDSADTEGDFEALIEAGLHGVKIHPDVQRFPADSPWAMQVYELCEDRGVPVLVHTGDFRYDYSNPPRIANILRRFPRLRFIGAHFAGWSVWDEAARLLGEYPNLVVDTSSSFYYIPPEKAKALIRVFGPERVMFGSDYPMWSRKNELEYIRRLELDADALADICFRTAERVFAAEVPALRAEDCVET